MRNRNAVIVTDPVPVPVPAPRKELIHRLRLRGASCAGTAPRWSSTRSPSSPGSADPDQASPRGRSAWPRMRRKTLVVCRSCHQAIHATPSRKRHNHRRAQCTERRPLGSEEGCAEKAHTCESGTSPGSPSCPRIGHHNTDLPELSGIASDECVCPGRLLRIVPGRAGRAADR